MAADDWRAANRANWNERVEVHLGAPAYEMDTLHAGRGQLSPIEEAELGPVEGLRVLHLQCHFGRDSLILAGRGADVTGLDFSPPAIATGSRLAAELGLAERCRFVEANLYDAPAAIAEPAGFDLVFVTWGALYWLPDIRRWAEIVAHFLKPGGALYLAEGHPAALVFDDEAGHGDRPGWFVPYFAPGPLVFDDPRDYADERARLTHARTYEWQHQLGAIVTVLIAAGLRLEWLHEHPAVPWRMYGALIRDGQGMYHWPDQPWLPLAFSLRASRPG